MATLVDNANNETRYQAVQTAIADLAAAHTTYANATDAWLVARNDFQAKRVAARQALYLFVRETCGVSLTPAQRNAIRLALSDDDESLIRLLQEANS